MRADGDDVRSLLFPRSLAVVGASPRNLEAVETVARERRSGLGRQPEPRRGRGSRCYPSVAELPEMPVCAFLMVNHERVEAGVRGSGGGGRSSVRRARRRRRGRRRGEADRPSGSRARARARRHRSSVRTAWASSSPAARRRGTADRRTRPAPGHVAVLCQSGSIADAFLSLGGRIGLRCVVSSGAEAVTDAADFLAFFAEDRERALSDSSWRR